MLYGIRKLGREFSAVCCPRVLIIPASCIAFLGGGVEELRNPQPFSQAEFLWEARREISSDAHSPACSFASRLLMLLNSGLRAGSCSQHSPILKEFYFF